MRVSTRFNPIASKLRIAMADITSDQAKSARLAAYARQEIAKAAAINRQGLGFDPAVEIFVDGRRTSNLDSVKPDGRILAEFALIDSIFEWIGAALVEASPVLTGRYSQSHVFLADGVAIEPGEPVPHGAARFVFLNVQPYARKIEKGLSAMAPDGVYDVVAGMARQRFGNIARISFGYESPLFGDIDRWAQTGSAAALAKRVRGGDARKHGEWLRRQPAIIITPR